MGWKMEQVGLGGSRWEQVEADGSGMGVDESRMQSGGSGMGSVGIGWDRNGMGMG